LAGQAELNKNKGQVEIEEAKVEEKEHIDYSLMRTEVKIPVQAAVEDPEWLVKYHSGQRQLLGNEEL
jgi:hypothetical protein